MELCTGIREKDRKRVCEGLSRLLADTYTLYLKTQYFHWNVTGPTFYSLHLLFEQQYKELAEAVDVIAERIRALGATAPGTYKEFIHLTAIKENHGLPASDTMVWLLLEGQETVIRTAREIFPLADDAEDDATAELLAARMRAHEKNAWMLRSLKSA